MRPYWGEGSMQTHSVYSFFLLTSFFLLFFPSLSVDQTRESDDGCNLCHTDINRMKTLITKFPELPEEEGEA